MDGAHSGETVTAVRCRSQVLGEPDRVATPVVSAAWNCTIGQRPSALEGSDIVVVVMSYWNDRQWMLRQ